MRGQQAIAVSALAAVVSLSGAWACAYGDYLEEDPFTAAERYCSIGCKDLDKEGDEYGKCCHFLIPGETLDPICSGMPTVTSSCYPDGIPTTDSQGYPAPSTYATASPTDKPVTSDIQGQSISSDSTVTEWTTTTVPAPCETTQPPVTSEAGLPTSSAADTNTCECSDSAQPTSSSTEAGGPSNGGMGNTPWADSTALGADMRRRTEKQYTCPCPAAPETSSVEGVPYTASPPTSAAGDPAPTTSPCTTSSEGGLSNGGVGNTPDGEVAENERRYLPTPPILGSPYGGPANSGRAADKRDHGITQTASAGHTALKRTEHEVTSEAAPSGGSPVTVTSTSIVTAECSETNAPVPSETECEEGDEAPSQTIGDGGMGNAPSAEVSDNEPARRRNARRW